MFPLTTWMYLTRHKSPKGEMDLFQQKRKNLYLTLVMHPMHLSLIKSYQIGPKGMKE